MFPGSRCRAARIFSAAIFRSIHKYISHKITLGKFTRSMRGLLRWHGELLHVDKSRMTIELIAKPERGKVKHVR